MNRIKDYQRRPAEAKKAVSLKEKQEIEAAVLKESQEIDAEDLIKVQSDMDGVDVNTQENAALALKDSQVEAAAVLKDTNATHANNLKKTQKYMDKKLDEKDQVISWVTGGYSVEGNLKKD